LHQLAQRPLRLAAAVAVLALALIAALVALPRDQAAATPPSGIAAELLARGTVADASHVRVAGMKLATRGPIDVATVHVTFQPGGSTGWHVHPGPALVTVKTGQLTLHRAKGCRTRTFGAGQTFLEFGPDDVNLTRNATGAVTETVVTFLLPVGAPVTVDAPAPRHCPQP
jgi:quercetin dioxygenase-like cupin family protein